MLHFQELQQKELSVKKAIDLLTEYKHDIQNIRNGRVMSSVAAYVEQDADSLLHQAIQVLQSIGDLT